MQWIEDAIPAMHVVACIQATGVTYRVLAHHSTVEVGCCKRHAVYQLKPSREDDVYLANLGRDRVGQSLQSLREASMNRPKSFVAIMSSVAACTRGAGPSSGFATSHVARQIGKRRNGTGAQPTVDSICFALAAF